jgi:hypothetical protein
MVWMLFPPLALLVLQMERKVDVREHSQSRKPIGAAIGFLVFRLIRTSFPGTDLQQQRLRAWQPLLTPFYVIGGFAVTGILFVVVGLVCLVASNSVSSVAAAVVILCDTGGRDRSAVQRWVTECPVYSSTRYDGPSLFLLQVD